MGRLAEISRVFLEEGFALSKPEDTERPETKTVLPRTDAEKGRRLCRALSRRGPTFVKFGQLLSMRLDLFSPEFLHELGQLRSHVPPFPSDQARKIIEAELDRPVDEIFLEFPVKPNRLRVHGAGLSNASSKVVPIV